MLKTKAFTLIEMMLVIAVIAIIAMFSLMMYQKNAKTARIDKAAVEMQHILEAALAYNVDKGEWPTPRSDEDCSSTQPDTADQFVKNYIPNQDAQSSYGSYFCWSPTGITSGGESDDHTGQRLFWVAMKVPDNDTQLAKRVAARLPNAIVTSDLTQPKGQPCNNSTCYVRAEVVQPGMSSNSQGGSGMVVATGDCPSRNNASNSNADSSTCGALTNHNISEYRITFNACPTSSKPRVTAFPNFVDVRMKRGALLGDLYAERTGSPCTTWTDAKGKQKQSCDIAVHATYCKSEHGSKSCGWPDVKTVGDHAGASYMVACVPGES